MTTCVWFTCERDYHKLAQSVARVRQLDPSARCVAIIDEHDTPPEGIVHYRRSFDRGVHLNTVGSVFGVAAVLYEFDGDLVVKLDSDMIVERAFWLEGPTLFQRANGFYVGAYAIPPRVLAGVWRSIASTPNTGPHEAIAICFRAAAIMHGFEIPFRHEHLPAGRLLPEDFTCI